MDITSYILGKKSGGGGGGGSTDPNKTAYRTQTTTEMNNLTTMKENDLCVVYSDTHDELTIPTTSGQTFYFPKNVILDTPITAEDSVTTGSGMGNYTFTISPTLFKVEYRVFTTTTQMQYSSTDGKNYTRTTNTNSLKINKSLTQDAIWLHYFMFPNRQTEYNGTYSYGVNSTWDRVPVTNLTPSNVKENIEILGVTGTYTGSNEKDVNFYDYLGNIVYSYTAQEFQALTELPAGPTHSNMTFQEWNWQLSEAKTYVTNHGVLDIGETCVTSDGKTRIYIDLPEGSLTPELYFAVNGSVTVDWGDNSTQEVVTGTSTSTRIGTPHTYPTHGKYVITLQSSNDVYFSGNGTASSGLLLDANYSPSNRARGGFVNTIEKVELGANIMLQSYAFYGASIKSINLPSGIMTVVPLSGFNNSDLEFITIPRNFTSIGNAAFKDSLLKKIVISNTVTKISGDSTFENTFLKNLIIPDSVTQLGQNLCYNCKELESVVLSNNITTFNKSNMFYYNFKLKQLKLPNSLQSITINAISECIIKTIEIPSGVTSLAVNAFYRCRGLSKIKFLGNFTGTINGFTDCYFIRIIDMRNNNSVPTLSSTTALDSLPSDFKVIVKDSLYNTWIASGNWPTYASHIVKASQYTE